MTGPYHDYFPGYIPTGKRPPLPEPVRQEVRQRSGGTCETCCERKAVDMHHTSYLDMWDHEDKTSSGEILHLCRTCHRQAHTDLNGEFWADIDEMNSWWSSYYDA